MYTRSHLGTMLAEVTGLHLYHKENSGCLTVLKGTVVRGLSLDSTGTARLQLGKQGLLHLTSWLDGLPAQRSGARSPAQERNHQLGPTL